MENKLMMKLVIATESILFLSLMITYVYFALRPGFTEASRSLLDPNRTGILSILLFCSSFTFWRAECGYRAGKTGKLKFWLGLTILLGGLFLVGQAWEYRRLLQESLSISKNIFGTNFFTLTGFHAFHVLVGLILLSVILFMSFAGDFDRPDFSVISSIGLYWHFVDLVWLLVFLIVYVSPFLLHRI